jgi:hypothetical protein
MRRKAAVLRVARTPTWPGLASRADTAMSGTAT